MNENTNLNLRKEPGYGIFSTIRSRLALLLLSILIPILIVQIIIHFERFETRRRMELKTNLEVAQAVAETFQGVVEDLLNQELLIGLALSSSQRLPAEDVYRLLKGNQSAYPYLLDVLWISPAGIIIASCGRLASGIDVSERSFFREIASGREWGVSDLSISEETGFPVFTVSRAVRGPAGALLGIVASTVLADHLEAAFPIERYGGGTILILDRSGRAVIRNPKVNWTWEGRTLLNRIPSVKEALAGNEITETIIDPLDKKKHLFALAPVRSIGWAVGAGRLEDYALGSIFSQLKRHALLFSAVVLVSILVSLRISNSISNPLKRLQRYALDLGKGKPKELTNFRGPLELLNLFHALNLMAHELNLQIEALAETKEQLESRVMERTADLEKQKEILQKIIDNIPVMLAFFNDQEILFLNRTALDTIGISSREIKNSNILERCYPDPQYRQEVLDFMTEAPAEWKEIRMIVRGGKEIETSWFNIRLADGSSIGIGLDVTERKAAERKMQRYVKELERSNKLLSKLSSELTLTEHRERRRLAEILHDHLQQLLVAAKMNCEILSARISTDQKQTAETIIKLIGQSIQAARSLTAELSPPFLQQGGLSAALEWLIRRVQENHGVAVELQTNPGIDPEREDITVLLFQSIRELLFNVVKHAGVKSARIEMACDEKNRLRVAVIDQGAGFDPETIWEKAQSGTGFGLFTIRERLMLLGGSLQVQSSPGTGSSFSLIVPLEITRKKDEKRIDKTIVEPHAVKTTGDKIRVLLADDHTVVRRGLFTMLNLHPDVEVIGEAADGEAAVRMSRELKPDVILMDVNMPNMDGLEATRMIHAEFPQIRIIGLSMFNADEKADAMIDAGASAYCTKDGETDVLLSAIRGKSSVDFCIEPAV